MSKKVPPPPNAQKLKLRKEHRRLWELRDASKGYQALMRRLALSNAVEVFQGNHAELKTFLNHIATPSVAAHMWAEAHRYRLEHAQREVARLLHNYVAAAFSLVDLTRRFVDKHYAGTELLKENKARTDRDFSEAPLHRFLQQLRNYTLHYRLPPMKAQTKFKRRDTEGDKGHEVENGFWLNVDKLREWDKWTGKGREYLESLGKEAKLDDIIDAYEPVVIGYHKWLQDRIREEHTADIEEMREIERRMQKIDEARHSGKSTVQRPPEPPEAPAKRKLVLTSLVGPAAREEWDSLATPEDVLVALYASLSYPHGGVPDLDRLRSLFLPNAQLVEVLQDDTYLNNVDGYIRKYHLALIEGSVTAVSEHETIRRSHPLGDVAHFLSFHETRYTENGKKKRSQGMYDLHLVKGGDRWAITSMHLCEGYGASLERPSWQESSR